MTGLAARLRPRWDALTVKVAEAAGVGLRQLGRTFPGVAGPLLVCYGLYDLFHPLGFIAAGGFLLVLDRRVP